MPSGLYCYLDCPVPIGSYDAVRFLEALVLNRYELFKNLMVMAASDGKMTDEEVQFLSLRSARWDLTDEQFGSALKYAERPDAKMSIPEDKQQRLAMLSELTRMMAVDGELADIEKQLFAVAAARMDISQQELDDVFDSLLK